MSLSKKSKIDSQSTDTGYKIGLSARKSRPITTIDEDDVVEYKARLRLMSEQTVCATLLRNSVDLAGVDATFRDRTRGAIVKRIFGTLQLDTELLILALSRSIHALEAKGVSVPFIEILRERTTRVAHLVKDSIENLRKDIEVTSSIEPICLVHTTKPSKIQKNPSKIGKIGLRLP